MIPDPGRQPTRVERFAGKGPRLIGLVARYADAWSAAWYGRPGSAHELRNRIGLLHHALDAARLARARLSDVGYSEPTLVRSR